MKVRVCSAYDDNEMERKINKLIAVAEDNDYYLSEEKYSLAYDENQKKVLRSALLIFDEYDEDDDED